MNSDDRIGQLNDLRLKTKSGNFNLSRPNSEEILENEMPGIRKEIPKEEAFGEYGEDSRKVEIDAIGKHGSFRGIHVSGIPDG